MALKFCEASGYDFNNVLMINLDADNVLGDRFVKQVDDHFVSRSSTGRTGGGSAPSSSSGRGSARPARPSRILDEPLIMQWESECKGIVGRLVYDAASFVALNGYNEDRSITIFKSQVSSVV